MTIVIMNMIHHHSHLKWLAPYTSLLCSIMVITACHRK